MTRRKIRRMPVAIALFALSGLAAGRTQALPASSPGTQARPSSLPRVPFSVQETSGDYTLRLTGARWARQAEFQPWRPAKTPQDKARRVLFIAGRITAAASTSTPAVLGDYTEAIALGPQGQRLVGSHTRSEAPEQGWTFENPDTRWNPVRLEFTLKEPSAPTGADGNISERADLTGVPVFGDVNLDHPFDRTLTTALGTKLVFCSLRYDRLPPSLGDLRNLILDFTLVPPASAPDLTVDISPQVVAPAIVDNLGDNLSNGNFLCSPHYQPPNYQLRLTLTTPPAAAQTLDLHLYIHQSAPNLRKAALFHTFAPVLLPKAAIGPAPREAAVAPVASVQGSGLRVTAESLTAGYSGNYYARLWIRDENPAGVKDLAGTKEWHISRATLRDAQGTEHDISGYASLTDAQAGHFETPLFWKLNGTPAQNNEAGVDLNFQSEMFQPVPRRLTLSLQLEQVMREYHALNFSGLPVPKPGQVLAVNAVSVYGPEGKYVVTKIGSFDAEHPLSFYNRAAAGNGEEMAPALYAVLSFVPAVPGGRIPSEQGTLSDALVVIDDQGGHLTRGDAASVFGYGEILDKPFAGWETLQAQTQPHPMLLVMTPPSPGAKTFSIRRRLTRAAVTGKTATLVVPNLLLPPPLKFP